MKSFVLAALTILVGTFIANINASTTYEPQIKADILESGLQDYLKQKNLELPDFSRSRDVEKITSSLIEDIESLKQDGKVTTDRLDKLEDRLSSLENKPHSVASSSLGDLQKQLSELKKQQSELDGKLVSFSKSKLSTAASLPSVSKYIARWSNHDGLSAREHAEKMHGINTAGLTDDQIARMRDRDHDEFGPDHPEEMRRRNQAATGSQFVSQKTSSKTVSKSSVSESSVPMQTQISTSSFQKTKYSTCPPGGCPGAGVQTRGGGLLGFGILGRNR